jgi:hypothetical protein
MQSLAQDQGQKKRGIIMARNTRMNHTPIIFIKISPMPDKILAIMEIIKKASMKLITNIRSRTTTSRIATKMKGRTTSQTDRGTNTRIGSDTTKTLESHISIIK